MSITLRLPIAGAFTMFGLSLDGAFTLLESTVLGVVTMLEQVVAVLSGASTIVESAVAPLGLALTMLELPVSVPACTFIMLKPACSAMFSFSCSILVYCGWILEKERTPCLNTAWNFVTDKHKLWK